MADKLKVDPVALHLGSNQMFDAVGEASLEFVSHEEGLADAAPGWIGSSQQALGELAARLGRQLAMKPGELERFLEPTLSHAGFKLDEVEGAAKYGERPAWAIYYRRQDCELQLCWSACDGGIDFMLAPLDAPNEFGLLNSSKKWQFMLMLSDVRDDIPTPGLDADDDKVMSWLKTLSKYISSQLVVRYYVEIKTAISVGLRGKRHGRLATIVYADGVNPSNGLR